MKAELKEFSAGGGWYLLVNDVYVVALMPADLEKLVLKYGPEKKHGFIKQVVAAHYEQEEQRRADAQFDALADAENARNSYRE